MTQITEGNTQGPVIDTHALQAESLLQFMRKLGYTPARYNGGFYTDNPGLAANQQVSTRTAIKLHNLSREDWILQDNGSYAPKGLDLKIRLNAYGVVNIQAAKFVKQVKLTPSRKASNGFIMPPDENAHLVKVADEAYRPMFDL